MLSKEASSMIFWVLGMTRPGIWTLVSWAISEHSNHYASVWLLLKREPSVHPQLWLTKLWESGLLKLSFTHFFSSLNAINKLFLLRYLAKLAKYSDIDHWQVLPPPHAHMCMCTHAHTELPKTYRPLCTG